MFVAMPVSAFNAVTEVVPVQYEVVSINEPDREHLILGELSNSPEMYEIVSEEPFTLTLKTRAVPDDVLLPQLNVMIIRQKEVRGVEEVARLKASDVSWEREKDGNTGLPYLAGPEFSEHLEAGTYHIEISTPDNVGKYMLMLGDTPDESGYFASLASVKMVHAFYGTNPIRLINSPFVHYPLGILLMLVLIGSTYLWHRRMKLQAVPVIHMSAKAHAEQQEND
jgi:hypothetical protein